MEASFKKLFILQHLLAILLLFAVYFFGYCQGKDSAESIKRTRQKPDPDGLPRIPKDQIYRFSNHPK